MATKRKKTPAAPVVPAAPAQIEQCQKCGCTELITQLRKVAVDIGWKLTQIHAIAPCKMCTKCGNTTVTINANIGDLANLVPDPDAVKQLQQQAAGKKKRSRKKAPAKKARKRGR